MLGTSWECHKVREFALRPMGDFLLVLDHNGKNVVATLAPLFFSGSSSFLQVTRATIISRMGSNFDQIRPLTAELSALECLKNQYFVL